MTLGLEWSEQTEFAAKPLNSWFVDGIAVGRQRSAGALSFVTVQGAGHMVRTTPESIAFQTLRVCLCGQVPYDKPKVALELLRRWLSKEEL